jgi:hypothetical protein
MDKVFGFGSAISLAWFVVVARVFTKHCNEVGYLDFGWANRELTGWLCLGLIPAVIGLTINLLLLPPE